MIHPDSNRLTSRDRRREFKDVRQSHSRRRDLSQSQLSKSVGKIRFYRDSNRERQTSRLTNIQNEESRYLKQIKTCHNNREPKQSRSHKNLMCVCCYNKKQAQYKQHRKNRQKQFEQEQIKQMKQSMIQTNLHKQLFYQSHVRQSIEEMNEYNRRLRERQHNKKLEEVNQKKQQGQMIKLQRQNFQMEKQNRARYSQQIRQGLKEKYEQQMRIKEEKQNRQKQINQSFDQNYIIDAIVPKNQSDRSAAQALRIAYKEDLLKQMQQQEAKKKIQISNIKRLSPQNRGNEFQLITFAEKRNEQGRRIANQLKQNQLKDINQKKNRQKFLREHKQIERVQKQRQRQRQISQVQAQKIQQDQLRRQKIDNYLLDLKGQIQHNKKKRLQQLQWINDRKLAEPFIRPRQVHQYDRDQCNGCHKKYPKKMLSEFVTIEE